MSIKKELVKVTGVKSGSLATQEFLEELTRKVAVLSDDDWEKLSEEAQTWFNEAATALNNEKDLPEFEEEEVSRRSVEKKEKPEEASSKKDKKSKKKDKKKDKKDKKPKKDKQEKLEDNAEPTEPGEFSFPLQRSAGNFVKLVLAQKPELTLTEVEEIVESTDYEVKGNSVKYAFEEMSRLLKLLTAAGFSIVQE